jgi:hypothetical protein
MQKNKPKKKQKRRATAYDRSQHQLVCKALGVSDSPDAPGLTAYEAVCVVLTKLDATRSHLDDPKSPFRSQERTDFYEC